MSAELLGLAFKADMGTHVAKLVLLKLVDAADDDGTNVYPAVATIAAAAQAHERTVQRLLRRFQKVDLLTLVEKGGGGPGSTNRYRLNLSVLRRIKEVGWSVATGEAPDEKGGLEPPMASEATGGIEDNKGGVSGHPTPPLDPLGERERAREESPTTAETLDRLKATWPDFALENIDLVTDALRKRTSAERQMLADRLPDFIAYHVEKRGKAKLPFLHNYVAQDNRWRDLPTREKPKPAGADGRVPAFSRTWWWLFKTNIGAGNIGQVRLRASAALSFGGGWPIDPMSRSRFDAMAEAELSKHPKDGSHALAWRTHWQTLGVSMPTPAAVDWVFLPPTGPPGSRPTNGLTEQDREFLGEGVGG